MWLISFNLTQHSTVWWADSALRWGLIVAITIAFSALGRLVRGVSNTGAIAGAVVCFALLASVGPAAFTALLVVFAVTWLATRFALRGRLLDAALECLVELGYGGTTTSVVAARAGVSRGAQLHHFPTRAALFCGDIFEMDLAMPHALGARVHLIDRAAPFSTYAYERSALAACGDRGRSSVELGGLMEWFK